MGRAVVFCKLLPYPARLASTASSIRAVTLVKHCPILLTRNVLKQSHCYLDTLAAPPLQGRVHLRSCLRQIQLNWWNDGLQCSITFLNQHMI